MLYPLPSCSLMGVFVPCAESSILAVVVFITVKCHLSGRHLSEHIGYPTGESAK